MGESLVKGCTGLLLTISPVATLSVASISSLVPVIAPASSSAAHRSAPRPPDGPPHAAAHHAHRVWLRRCFLDVDFVPVDVLLRGLEEVRHYRLLLEGDEAEALALVLLLVERQLHLDDVPEFAEVGLDVVVAQVWLEAADEDLAVPRLRLLGVDLLAVNYVVACVDDLPSGG